MKHKREAKPRQAHSISTDTSKGQVCINMHDGDGNIFAFGYLGPSMAHQLCVNIVNDINDIFAAGLRAI